MALSPKVEEALGDAESHLRSALASAARSERPVVIQGIAEVVARIDNIRNMDTMIDKIEKATEKGGPPFGTMFS